MLMKMIFIVKNVNAEENIFTNNYVFFIYIILIMN